MLITEYHQLLPRPHILIYFDLAFIACATHMHKGDMWPVSLPVSSFLLESGFHIKR